jgi:hypothetical protein
MVSVVAFKYSPRSSQVGHIVSPNGSSMLAQTVMLKSFIKLFGQFADKLAKGADVAL